LHPNALMTIATLLCDSFSRVDIAVMEFPE
jgi:hypothetical protein